MEAIVTGNRLIRTVLVCGWPFCCDRSLTDVICCWDWGETEQGNRLVLPVTCCQKRRTGDDGMLQQERDGSGNWSQREAADCRLAPTRRCCSPVSSDRLSFNTTLTRVTQSLSLQIHTTTGCGVCVQSTGGPNSCVLFVREERDGVRDCPATTGCGFVARHDADVDALSGLLK